MLAVLDPATCEGHFTGALLSFGKDGTTVHNADTNFTLIENVRKKIAAEANKDENEERWPLPSWTVPTLREVAELLDPPTYKGVLGSFNAGVGSSGEPRDVHFDEHVWHHDQVKAGNCPHFQARVLLIQALGHILLDLQMSTDAMRSYLRELKHFLKQDALLSIADFLSGEDAAKTIAEDYEGRNVDERMERLLAKYSTSG
jgi:hypothetical protein